MRRPLEQICIKVTGIIDGWTLYQDLGDIYRDTAVWRDHDPDLRMVARIGLRPFPEDMVLASTATGARRVTLIGRLHDCDSDWGVSEADEGGMVVSMGSGWCHYNSGAVLTPFAIVAQDSVAVTRKTGKQAWRQFGDIAPLKSDSALGPEALTFLARLFDAVYRADRRAVLNFHDYSLISLAPDGIGVAADELEGVAGSDAQRVLDLWFGNSGSVLSQMQSSSEHPDVRLFEPRWKTDDWPEIWACWGAGSLGEDDWPISSMDAVNVAGRPYACVSLVKERHQTGASQVVEDVWVAGTFGGPSAMAEPPNLREAQSFR